MRYANHLVWLLSIGYISSAIAIRSDLTNYYDVTAERTDYNREQQRLIFTGHVIAKRPDSVIRGDQLVLYLNAKNKVQKLVCTGQLAHFTMHFAEKPYLLQGEAQRITYDVTKQLTWFNGNAHITRGPHQLSGPALRYHLTDNTLQVNGTPQQRTRIILQPHDVETAS